MNTNYIILYAFMITNVLVWVVMVYTFDKDKKNDLHKNYKINSFLYLLSGLFWVGMTYYVGTLFYNL